MEFQLDSFSFGLMIWQIILFVTLFFWLFCVIDVLRNSFNGNDKLVWVLVLLFVPILGPLLYFFIGKKKNYD
ncbi:PLDc N-terminal domain-containing protein [Flavobacterium cucumis]|uniref:Phospholipase_D-nuclease N-terminal n=1 Tax=Flavobacterium cucumis TaxID=416016 RepID=A0A1M7ZUW7_9FLAO|nr:PLDc N-terminal domain-containing protein [Flavobacterium cucumis]SHO72674.1 Phospholipase_D-nuclease N-terminal [Flavobacterium cucumis]